MKSRRRDAARRDETAERCRTADLFAAPAAAKVAVEASPVAAPRPAPVRGVVLPPAPGGRPRPRQLWYAAVFPSLAEPQRAAVLQRLCLSAQRFTPFVSIEIPNALLLEIKGSVRLFGSLTGLHAAIDAAWHGLSLPAQSAIAPTTLAALWLARAAKRVCIEDPAQLAGRLGELPIDCAGWDAQWLQTLRAMGVIRIGELLRLPRDGIARRLAPAAVWDLDIALARQAAPRRAFIPRERFRTRCDFETEVETVAYLQKALEPLIERCARFLRERQAGIQALQLTLHHRVIPATRVRIGLASITGDRRRLANVLDDKLQRLELAASVRGLELRSGSLQPLSSDSMDAFAGLHGGGLDTAPQLVERLRARLGEDAVYGVCAMAEHRPEAAWRRVHELRLTADVRMPDARTIDMPRPVWLLDRPVPLAPGRRELSRRGLCLEQGPERIESGWWDGKDVTRDYYVARNMGGARWWVFQERRSRGWYWHGVFA